MPSCQRKHLRAIVAADVRRRTLGLLSSGNPPPHVGGYGVLKHALKARWVMAGFWAMVSVSAPASTNAPALEFLSNPPFGSNSNLFGRVLNVNRADFRVAVYIYVGGWYNKPSFGSPLTDIQTNGDWTCDITTAGNDS